MDRTHSTDIQPSPRKPVTSRDDDDSDAPPEPRPISSRPYPFLVGIAGALLIIYAAIVLMSNFVDISINLARAEPKLISAVFAACRLLTGAGIFLASIAILVRWRIGAPTAVLAAIGDLGLCILERLYVFFVLIPAARAAEIEHAAQAKNMDLFGGGGEPLFNVAPIMAGSNAIVTIVMVGMWLLLCGTAFMLLYINHTRESAAER